MTYTRAKAPLLYHRFSSRPTQVPRRWHRPAAQPASAADQLSARERWTCPGSFPARPSGRAVGSSSEPSFEAVMFPPPPLPPHRPLTPRVVSSSPPRPRRAIVAYQSGHGPPRPGADKTRRGPTGPTYAISRLLQRARLRCRPNRSRPPRRLRHQIRVVRGRPGVDSPSKLRRGLTKLPRALVASSDGQRAAP